MQGLLQQPAEMRGAPQGAPQELPPEGMPPETMEEGMDEGADESHPAFQASTQLIRDALYKEGAADNLHNIVAKNGMSAEVLADTAYDMLELVEDKTGGVPDELLARLAVHVVEEVVDIALASGEQLEEPEITEAVGIMVVRWAGEMGFDTRELQQAIDAALKEMFNEREV